MPHAAHGHVHHVRGSPSATSIDLLTPKQGLNLSCAARGICILGGSLIIPGSYFLYKTIYDRSRLVKFPAAPNGDLFNSEALHAAGTLARLPRKPTT